MVAIWARTFLLGTGLVITLAPFAAVIGMNGELPVIGITMLSLCYLLHERAKLQRQQEIESNPKDTLR